MNRPPARSNPFRAARIEALAYRFGDASEDTNVDDLLKRLAALGGRAALVGNKGSGKTTLLEEIERRHEAEGRPIARVRLRRERRRPTTEERLALRGAGPETLVTVDGAEQLGVIAWRRLLFASRRAGALLITVHRPGRLPTLREHATSPELLHDLVAELLAPGEPPSMEALAELHARRAGNLRECLRELYDAWSPDRGGPHPLTPSPEAGEGEPDSSSGSPSPASGEGAGG